MDKEIYFGGTGMFRHAVHLICVQAARRISRGCSCCAAAWRCSRGRAASRRLKPSTTSRGGACTGSHSAIPGSGGSAAALQVGFEASLATLSCTHGPCGCFVCIPGHAGYSLITVACMQLASATKALLHALQAVRTIQPQMQLMQIWTLPGRMKMGRSSLKQRRHNRENAAVPQRARTLQLKGCHHPSSRMAWTFRCSIESHLLQMQRQTRRRRVRMA